jgi:hypothetical protein
MNDDKASVIKAGVAWGGVWIARFLDAFGIHSWGDFAAMLASVYSAFLIFEWLRKQWRAMR